MYEMICVVISGLTFVWVLSVRSWNSVAFIEASLEELPVRAELGQSCLATKISAPEPSIFGWFRHSAFTAKTFFLAFPVVALDILVGIF